MLKKFSCATVTIFIIYAAALFGQVPRTISYQGVLTDTTGHPKPDDVYNFTFRIYTSSSGGSALWSESKSLKVNHGLFSTMLGDVNPIGLPFDQQYWLSIQVSTDPELSPRIRLSSSGYSFRSIKSDTALYSLNSAQQNFADSSRIAGTIPDGVVTNKKIADNSVTSTKIALNQVVKKINGLSDNITLSATGGATITSNGDTITINAGSGGTGTGIQGVQNTDNTLSITNPSGPTATINVKSQGIGTTQIADGSVSQTKIANGVTLPPSGTAGGDLTGTYPNPTVTNNAITSAKILDGTISTNDLANNSVISSKISSGQVVKSINTLKDNVTLSAGSNVTITPSGNNLTISSTAGLTLPYSNTVNSTSTLFTIINSGTGQAGSFQNTNSSTTFPVMDVSSNGSGTSFVGLNNGNGSAGSFIINNTNNSANALNVITNGTGYAINGINTNTKLRLYGIFGEGKAGGIIGYGDSSDVSIGVYGHTKSANGAGLYGEGGLQGVWGGGEGIGVQGVSPNGKGVYGEGSSGVYGISNSGGEGIYGEGSRGVWGLSSYGFGSGVEGWGTTKGIYSHNLSNASGTDVYLSEYSYAAEMYGNVNIVGNITKSGGSFKIDDPLDPANKYLYHSFVESPDMKNIYDGVVTLDASGQATVTLPDWFEALNMDFRYQLTAIGAPGPNLYISKEISGNSFSIAGGTPGMKVSWQVTGIRHDAWADAHRIPVEEDKNPQERGYYLHPELFGQTQSKMIQYAIHPEIQQIPAELQKVQAEHQKMQAENQKMQEKIKSIKNKIK